MKIRLSGWLESRSTNFTLEIRVAGGKDDVGRQWRIIVIMMKNVHRDKQESMTVARRAALLNILRNERYLTQFQLIARIELLLGKGCFGISSNESAFYRDLRVVKQTLKSEGHLLAYRRGKGQAGYYLQGQPALSPEFKQMLRGSAAEVEQGQIEIYQRLSPADRFRQGCAISDTARNVVAFRIRQENPNLSVDEAHRLALQRAYRL